MPRFHHRVRGLDPRFYRDETTRHEPGLGGMWLHVTYGGEDLGEIVSRWSYRDGVHWQIIISGMVVAEPSSNRPLALTSRDEAANVLLSAHGWEPNYNPGG